MLLRLVAAVKPILEMAIERILLYSSSYLRLNHQARNVSIHSNRLNIQACSLGRTLSEAYRGGIARNQRLYLYLQGGGDCSLYSIRCGCDRVRCVYVGVAMRMVDSRLTESAVKSRILPSFSLLLSCFHGSFFLLYLHRSFLSSWMRGRLLLLRQYTALCSRPHDGKVE